MKYHGIEYSDNELKEADPALAHLYQFNLHGTHEDPPPAVRDVLLALDLAEEASTPGNTRISNEGRLAKRFAGIKKYLIHKRNVIRWNRFKAWLPIAISLGVGLLAIDQAHKNTILLTKQPTTTQKIEQLEKRVDYLHHNLELRIDSIVYQLKMIRQAIAEIDSTSK